MASEATRISTVLIAALAVCVASGQDPKPAEPPQKEPEEAAAPKEPMWPLRYEIGWSEWNLDGNRHKFRQYGSPPDGFYLKELLLEDWNDGLGDGFRLRLLTPGEDDYRAVGSVSLNYGMTRLDGYADRTRFADTTPEIVPGSQRHGTEGLARQYLNRDFLLSFRARTEQLDRNFQPGYEAFHQRTDFWNVSATGMFGGGFMDLSFTNWNYYDRTDVLPDSDGQRIGLSYARSLTPNFDIEGAYSRTTVDLPGSENNVNDWSIGGEWAFGPATQFQFDFRRQSLELPAVQNAYVRERSMGRARLIHRWPNWTAQFGFTRRDIERVRGDQSFVDDIAESAFDARLAGRLTPWLRFSARYGQEVMDQTATMVTADPRMLYWDERDWLQVKLDGGTEQWTGYAVFGARESRNGIRDTRVRSRNITLGGSYQANPNLELYFEGTSDFLSGRSRDPNNPNLEDFLGDASVLTFGANWTISPAAYAAVSYSRQWVDNENPLAVRDTNVKGSFLTASINYRLPQGFELGLTIAPWRYDDRQYDLMGYDTFLVALTAKGRF